LFLPRYRLTRPGKGGISFVCQSGAAGSALLDLASKEGYGFAKFISYGNAINLDEADLIEYLGKDPETKVICLYVEGVKQGQKFIKVCQQVSKTKPIIAIKGGLTEHGSKATLSHTGSLAGSAVVYGGVFRQAGIIHAEHLEDMFSYARILEKCIKPKGKRVQVITNGGGYGILATDSIIQNNLQMADMDKKVLAKLKKLWPPLVTVANPMDLVGDATEMRYKQAIEAAMNDKGVDILLLILLYQTPLLSPEVVEIVSEFNNQKKKPIVVVSTGGEFTELLKHNLEEKGVPSFTFPAQAVEAIRELCNYYLK
jgi:acyl-CoA synthetase (NDP forming)